MGAVPAARGGADARSASWSGRWSSSRPTTRWRRGGEGGARPARRARAHLHARQGPGAVRQRHARRPARPPRAHDPRRGRRGREVRRAAGVDSRLPGAGRRQRATAIPGLPGWGAKSAAAVLAKFGHIEPIPDDYRHVGRGRARAGRAGGDARSAIATWRCCSAISRRSGPTSRCSTPWTSSSGTGRRRRSRRWPHDWRRPRIRPDHPFVAGGGRAGLQSGVRPPSSGAERSANHEMCVYRIVRPGPGGAGGPGSDADAAPADR